MLTNERLDQLQKNANLLLKAVQHKSLMLDSHAIVMPLFCIVDDSYSVIYYPHGHREKGYSLQMDLKAMQLKAYLETLPENIDFFIDWRRCFEWQYFNICETDEERNAYLKLIPELRDIPEELVNFLREMPPMMHRIK